MVHPQPALAIVLRSLAVKPPAFEERSIVLACVGLHALARRYQRGAARDDAAVLADLHPLGRGGLEAFRDGGEFAIPAPGGGRWIGAVAPHDRTVMVRTFFAESDKC
jgi:hypothetical protein